MMKIPSNYFNILYPLLGAKSKALKIHEHKYFLEILKNDLSSHYLLHKYIILSINSTTNIKEKNQRRLESNVSLVFKNNK